MLQESCRLGHKGLLMMHLTALNVYKCGFIYVK